MQDMTGFYVDPWAGDGNLGLGNDLTMETIFGEIGPQTDGTYNVPAASQQVNSPQNTAGYSTATPDWVKNVLTQGIGVLGQYVNTKQAIDYKKWESTNGGLFLQGMNAGLYQRQAIPTNPRTSLALLILLGLFLIARK